MRSDCFDRLRLGWSDAEPMVIACNPVCIAKTMMRKSCNTERFSRKPQYDSIRFFGCQVSTEDESRSWLEEKQRTNTEWRVVFPLDIVAVLQICPFASAMDCRMRIYIVVTS